MVFTICGTMQTLGKIPVADAGFSWGGGRQLPKVGVLTYYFAIFLPKAA